MHYRLYTMKEDRHIVSAIDMNCTDDEAACIQAMMHENTAGMELWRGSAKIAYFVPKVEETTKQTNVTSCVSMG